MYTTFFRILDNRSTHTYELFLAISNGRANMSISFSLYLQWITFDWWIHTSRTVGFDKVHQYRWYHFVFKFYSEQIFIWNRMASLMSWIVKMNSMRPPNLILIVEKLSVLSNLLNTWLNELQFNFHPLESLHRTEHSWH